LNGNVERTGNNEAIQYNESSFTAQIIILTGGHGYKLVPLLSILAV